MNFLNAKPMFNAYPDSLNQTLGGLVDVLSKKELENVFGSFYILPSMFNTDLDRGFSVINYDLNKELVTEADLEKLAALNIDLKLDFILNHASVLSPQFQDLIKNGDQSAYKDFFINWNEFWNGHGEMTEAGFIQPKQEYIKDMFFRKPGLPILMVKMPDGTKKPYWNTFYQKVMYKKIDAHDLIATFDIQYSSALRLAQEIQTQLDAGIKLVDLNLGKYEQHRHEIVTLLETECKYLGQMDLNIKSPLVWDFYDDTLQKLSKYGSKIVRLDAFAYASKEIGKKNFLNDPETWDVLARVDELATKYELNILPEIHATYEEKIYETLSEKGYMTYDFFLPGLMIDAIENQTVDHLLDWAKEIVEKDIKVVNMLGCHDGIPLLDLKGIIKESQIEALIDLVVSRGGYVKNLHGQKNMYYQVNATYYSALGESDAKMLLARAIQMFMPGKPQVWYLDLFAGINDYEGVKRAGVDGHKEINRTNLTMDQIEKQLELDVVKQQIELIKFRNECEAFGFDAQFEAIKTDEGMILSWTNHNCKASLHVNIQDYSYEIKVTNL